MNLIIAVGGIALFTFFRSAHDIGALERRVTALEQRWRLRSQFCYDPSSEASNKTCYATQGNIPQYIADVQPINKGIHLVAIAFPLNQAVPAAEQAVPVCVTADGHKVDIAKEDYTATATSMVIRFPGGADFTGQCSVITGAPFK